MSPSGWRGSAFSFCAWDEEGKVPEWRSQALTRYQRLTKKAEGLIAAVYLAGTYTRRVKRALFGVFELFSDIIAFSPGFAAPGWVEDAPRVLLSDGREDEVLPIDRCGRPAAARLERAGFDIEVREFTGGHVVPREMVGIASDRLLSRRR